MLNHANQIIHLEVVMLCQVYLTSTIKFLKQDVFLLFQGHFREGKCHLLMGETAAAICSYEKVLQIDSHNTAAKNDVSTNPLLVYVNVIL